VTLDSPIQLITFDGENKQHSVEVHQVFLVALLFSFLIHFLYLYYFQFDSKPASFIKENSRLSIVLKAFTDDRSPGVFPGVVKPGSKPLKNVKPRHLTRPVKDLLPATSTSKHRQEKVPTPLITPERITELIRQLPKEQSAHTTENGAVVMNKPLLEILARSERKTGYTPFLKTSLIRRPTMREVGPTSS